MERPHVPSRAHRWRHVTCHLGCALREWLIINGSHRGTNWSDGRTDDADLVPLLDADKRPVTFTRWYTGWLERAEHSVLPTSSDV
ncbi:hypothetical protein ACFVGX_23360 [Streptomyces sp. NPDC127113]|uniref:hypothetical protein n=1 Tax=unclassified Streptomyces TaxID=2593676 RepID=UPI003211E5F4